MAGCIMDTLFLGALFVVVWIVIDVASRIAKQPLNPTAVQALAAIAFLIVMLNLIFCLAAHVGYGTPHYWFYR